MRAVVATEYGPPEKLTIRDVPAPSPGPGQVRVRMEAAAVNPYDLKLLTGEVRDAVPLSFPYLPGMDGTGIVDATDSAVTRFTEGTPVLGYFNKTAGTFAEYAVIDDGPEVAVRPPGLDPAQAAAIPESGMTAHALLQAVPPKPDQTVLVVGATGGLGMFLVQLARAAGARVVATAAGPQDAAYVGALGADEVIDYTIGDIVQQVLHNHPDGVDVVYDVIDAGSGLRSIAHAARPGGQVVSPLGGPADLGRGVQGVYIGTMTPQPGVLDDLAALAASGALRVEVNEVYPLDQTPKALRDFIETHFHGKKVIRTTA